MSNLLKSKFFLGVMVATGFALASTAGAAYMHTTTLKMGMSGAQVSSLQATLNMTSCKVGAGLATGVFGPLTQTAVKCFQATNGLTADGVVGPMTGAALAGTTGGSTGGTTGGTTCPNGMLLSNNCQAPASTGGSTGLTGDAGTLEQADFVSSLNNEEVGEDQENVPVVGLDLTADDGSDLAINSVRVSFEEQAAGGSVDFDDYADSVSIWFEGEEVGSADVSDFNEDSDVWSKTISLDGDTVIDADDEGRLEVAVSALSNIDSNDIGSANNDWEVTIENVRYEDASGVVQTESALDDIGVARAFFFDTFAASNDVELKAKKSSDSPAEQVVTVDTDGGEEVLLLAGTLTSEGSDITVKDLTVTVTPAGTGDASEIATRYMLKIGGEEVDSIDSDECEVVGDCDGTGTNTAVDYVFNDMDDYTVDEDDSVDFEVWAELDEISATFVEGDSLDSSVNADDINAEDQSGEDLGGTELSGVVNGEEQTFYSEGIVVEVTSATAVTTFVADDAAETSVGKFVVTFKVTANETDVYLDKSTDGSGTAGNNGEGVVYTIDSSATASASSATFECTSGCGDSGDNTVDEFYIAEGDTETYRLTVTVTGDDTPTTADFAVWIDSINWEGSDVAAATEFFSSNLGEDSDADTGNLSLIAL